MNGITFSSCGFTIFSKIYISNLQHETWRSNSHGDRVPIFITFTHGLCAYNGGLLSMTSLQSSSPIGGEGNSPNYARLTMKKKCPFDVLVQDRSIVIVFWNGDRALNHRYEVISFATWIGFIVRTWWHLQSYSLFATGNPAVTYHDVINIVVPVLWCCVWRDMQRFHVLRKSIFPWIWII